MTVGSSYGLVFNQVIAESDILLNITEALYKKDSADKERKKV